MCSNVSEKLEGHPTNQRAELVVSSFSFSTCILDFSCGPMGIQSACRALETAIQQGHNEVELRTDSSYTIKGEPLTLEISIE